uniref:Uncharacterized protein n=1 Tax=Rhizophagus irregularis (strain DAOM 181602 / DAOM 197198 / MUCL 43194) TaxID=747089 RepID=U9UGD9_RHIID
MRILITWFFGYCDEFDVWEYGGSFSLLKHEFGGSLWDSGVDQVIGCVTYFLNFWIQISDARKSKIFLFFLSELGCGFWQSAWIFDVENVYFWKHNDFT